MVKYDMFGFPIAKPNKEISKPKTQPVSKSQKNEVLARQKNKCAKCHKLLDMRATHFDHATEVYKGGKSIIKNLQALCANCHSIKTNEDRLKQVEKKRKMRTEPKSKKSTWINPLTGKKEVFTPFGI